jgi:hypothetical protein
MFQSCCLCGVQIVSLGGVQLRTQNPSWTQNKVISVLAVSRCGGCGSIAPRIRNFSFGYG